MMLGRALVLVGLAGAAAGCRTEPFPFAPGLIDMAVGAGLPGAPGRPASRSVPFPPPAPPTCGAVAVGAACQFDCQCQAGDARARCLTRGANDAVCGYSCSEDVDCPGDRVCDRERGFECVSR